MNLFIVHCSVFIECAKTCDVCELLSQNLNNLIFCLNLGFYWFGISLRGTSAAGSYSTWMCFPEPKGKLFSKYKVSRHLVRPEGPGFDFPAW